MTSHEKSRKTGFMARPKRYVESMVARFRAGTFDRISAVLQDGEDRADFVRIAIENEISRRQTTDDTDPST